VISSVLKSGIRNNESVSFGQLQEPVPVFAASSKAIMTNDVSSVFVAGACACIPIASDDNQITARDAIDKVLQIVVEFVFRFFFGIKRRCVDGNDGYVEKTAFESCSS
jgi:hypothetical protein